MPIEKWEESPRPTGGSPERSGSRDGKLNPQELEKRHDVIAEARAASSVKRYHAFPIIGEQNNGHHTYNMVALLLLLHPNPDLTLIRVIMFHDSAEHILGDAPSPGLNTHTEYSLAYNNAQNALLLKIYGMDYYELRLADRQWLHSLDKLEAMIFGYNQISLGNANAERILKNVKVWFEQNIQYGHVPTEVAQYFNFLVKENESE